MRTMQNIADEWIAEGISITRCVLLGDEALAKQMVRNVFDAQEFKEALTTVAWLEVLRLDDKTKRFCCEKGEALGLAGMCCQDCAAINDGYAGAMTPNARNEGADAGSSRTLPLD